MRTPIWLSRTRIYERAWRKYMCNRRLSFLDRRVLNIGPNGVRVPFKLDPTRILGDK